MEQRQSWAELQYGSFDAKGSIVALRSQSRIEANGVTICTNEGIPNAAAVAVIIMNGVGFG